MKKTPITLGKWITAATVAMTLVLQSCLLTHAYSQDQSYPYWDDPDYQDYYYYWEDANVHKITSVTRAYDDGTKYTAHYKYNDYGMTEADIKEANGNTITIKRVYQGADVISSSLSEYDSSDQSVSTKLIEHGNDTTPAYSLSRVQYADKTFQSEEMWYYDPYAPLKTIKTERNGYTEQTEFTYGQHDPWSVSSKTTASNGSESTQEYRHNDYGQIIYEKSYSYDATTQITNTLEAWFEGDRITGTFRTIEITSAEGGEQKVESWGGMTDYNVTKRITTLPNGTQFTEAYSFDDKGNETLYTKTGDGQPTARRETIRNMLGVVTSYTDGEGLSRVSRKSHDKKTNIETLEETTTYPDGSSSYLKEVYDYDNWLYLEQISRKKDSQGRESYEEKIRSIDGSKIVREKTKDGVITTEEYDSEGAIISNTRNLADGTAIESTKEYNENQTLAREISHYADGSEDRIEYEYDNSSRLIKTTESRRNGMSAITQYDRDELTTSESTIFNTGQELSFKSYHPNDSYREYTFTDSHGEISQEVLILSNTFDRLTITYRDGKVESFSTDSGDLHKLDLILMFEEHQMTSYEDVWLSVAGSETPIATGSNASPVVVAGEE